MIFRFLVFGLFFCFTASSLEKILEDNLDVVDYCMIRHFNLGESHPKMDELYSKCSSRVDSSAEKQRLRDVLLGQFMNKDFITMILNSYEGRSLSENRLLMSYLVADFNDYEEFKVSFASRLVSRKMLLRHNNDVPHFSGSRKALNFRLRDLQFKYNDESYTIRISTGAKTNISTVKSSEYYEIVSHALRNLMQLGNFSPIELTLTSKSNNSYSYLDPNYLLFQIYTMTSTNDSNMVMLGDVNSKGDYLRYGYLRSALDGLSDSEKFVLVSEEAKEQLLEVIKVEGIKTLSERIFISPKNLKDAAKIIDSPTKYHDFADTFKILISNIKHKSKWPGIIKTLDQLISENPRLLSAKVLKDVLTGKVTSRLSFASSYREFNWFFRVLDMDNTSAKLLTEIKSEIAKVKNKIHPEFRFMVQACDEIADDRLLLLKTPRPTARKKGGTQLSRGGNAYAAISQRLYKRIRELRLKRDILLDKQHVLESIFER